MASTLALWPVPAGATVRAPLRITELSVAGSQLSFIQPDGSLTVLDLTTGDVLRRGGSFRHPGQEPLESWNVYADDAVRALPEGVLSVEPVEGGYRLELQSNNLHWVALHRFPGPESPWHFAGSHWFATASGTLLIEKPGWDLGFLECVDLLSGSSRWLYVHPATRHSLRSYDTELVAHFRHRLDDFLIAARQGRWRLGTVPLKGEGGAEAALNLPNTMPIRVDPDPVRATWSRALWLCAGSF